MRPMTPEEREEWKNKIRAHLMKVPIGQYREHKQACDFCRENTIEVSREKLAKAPKVD